MADLDEDVNFPFDEQVIQDERLLNLEETSLGIIGELDLIEDDLEGEGRSASNTLRKYSDNLDNTLSSFT